MKQVSSETTIELGQLELTPAERLILANQYKILEALSRSANEAVGLEHPSTYEWCARVVLRGHSLLYGELKPFLSPRIPTMATQQFVTDVLQMFRHIQKSFAFLGSDTTLREEDVAFRGWDGASRSGEYDIAETVCRRSYNSVSGRGGHVDDRFEDVKPRPVLNAHAPYTEYYRAMLLQYKLLGFDKKPRLTEADIRQVLEVQV